jgi:gas vesicle protein
MSQTTVHDGGTSTAQEKVQDAAGQAREKAQEGAQRARQGLSGQLDQRSTQAGQRVSSQSEDIRTVAQQLREQGKEGPAKLAEQAADRTQRVGRWLEDSDGDQIIGEVEDFARRQPWAVVLGGLAVGFAASRVLRASSSERYQRSGANRESMGLPRPEPYEPPSYEPPTYEPPVASTPTPAGERLR